MGRDDPPNWLSDLGGSAAALPGGDAASPTNAPQSLSALAQLVPDAFIVTDSQGRIVLVNAQAEAMFGYRRDELLGQPVERLLPERIRERHREHRAGYYVQPRIRQMGTGVELYARRKDGSEFPVDVTLGPLPTDAGILVASAVRDLTERERATDALRRSEERYRTLVENINDIVYAVAVHDDPLRGRVDFVTDQARALVGYAPEAFVQDEELWRRIIHPDDLPYVVEVTERLVATRETTTRVYRVRHGETGEYRWIEDRVVTRLDDHGRVVGFIGVARDITERRRLREQLQQAQKMDALGRLAGGIAHDFNNLLMVINGFGELALQRLDAAHPVREYVAEMKKAGESAASLTQQLLAFSRREVVAPQVLDLNAVVAGVEGLLRRTIGDDIALVTRLAPDLGPVRADPGQMQQVIINLAVNARDAMPQGGTLTIETASVELDEEFVRLHHDVRPGPHALLAVTDKGTGMTPEVKARIFEPFFTTKERSRGTGLGLSTVYGIVAQSGGTIWVDSAPGLGTTFKIYFPCFAGQAAATAVAAEPALSEGDGSETVLLVEDDTQVRDLVRRVLVAHGYTVLEAREGAAALALAEQHDGPIDLLLTDVVLPGMSGPALAEGLVARRPGVRAVYMSGYTDNALVHHGVLDAGMELLQKPFRPAALLRKVRQVLDAIRG